MIHNKDCIVQMIEAAGKAIAKAVGFKEQGSYSQALETMNDFYSEHFDLMHIDNETNSIKLDLYGNLLKIEAAYSIYFTSGGVCILNHAGSHDSWTRANYYITSRNSDHSVTSLPFGRQ